MPIGAVIGGAAIAGVGTVAAGALGAGATKSAANQAAQTSSANAAANDALLKEIHGENTAVLAPYVNNGIQPSNALNDLLLGTHTFNPSAAPVVAPSAAPTTGAGALSGYTGPSLAQIQGMQHDGIPGNYRAALSAYNAGQGSGALAQPTGAITAPVVSKTPVDGTVTASPGAGTPNGALSAFDQFRQGDNYQFRLNQGEGALNSKYAANGTFDSGAADKSIVQYGQNFASNELSNYMNLLASQQAMGLSAAGAIAGVGTTYAGNVTANNTAAANAAANAALASGNAQAGLYGSIGQGVGQLGGALFQYGMGQQARPPQVNFGSMFNASNAVPVPVDLSTPPPTTSFGGF